MRLIFSSLLAGGAQHDFTQSRNFAPIVANWSDMEAFLDVEAGDLTTAERSELRHDLAMVMAREIPDPQFRKVHDCWGCTPSGRPIFPPAATLGSLYLVRDPRDVVVSWAHHTRMSLDDAVDFVGHCRTISSNHAGWNAQIEQNLGSWSDHVSSWLAAQPAPLLIRYEDLLADPAPIIQQAANHCGISASPATIAAALSGTNFQSLQAQERQTGFNMGQAPGQNFFRRGIAGDWRRVLARHQLDRIYLDHGPTMARLGYTETE